MEVTLLQFRPAYDVLAYFSFSGAPLAKSNIENVQYPSISTSPQLPCLRINHEMFVAHAFIFDYLKKNVADLDAGLSSQLNSELRAFSSLVRLELKEALDVARYDDEEHWWKVTYPQLVKALPWPFNRAVARKIRHDVLQTLQNLPGKQGERLNGWAVKTCRTAYKAISERLGDANWVLHTAGPTSLDALIFGHLANAKFEPKISDVLIEFPNLGAYYEKILVRIGRSKFFSLGTGGFPGPNLGLTIQHSIPSSAGRIAAKKIDQPKNSSEDGGGILTEGSSQALAFALCTILAYLGWSQVVAVSEIGEIEGGAEE